MHTGRGDRLRNRSFSHISDLCDLDLGSGHTAYHRVALIELYLSTNFVQIGPLLLRRLKRPKNLFLPFSDFFTKETQSAHRVR